MDVSIFQGTWLVSIVFPCVIHVAFLASVIHCLAAASRPRPAQRKKLRPVDPKTLETSNDGVYAASPASHDPDMAIMFVGPRAEAREWSDEERIVVESIRDNLGPDLFARAEAFDHSVYRMVRCMWDEFPPNERGDKMSELLQDLFRWRDEGEVDSILDTLLEQHEAYHQGWPSRIYGCDKFGHPIVAERMSHINVKMLTQELGIELVTRHRVQHFEAVTRWKRGCSNKAGYRLYRQNVILDLKDFALFDHFNETGKAFLFALVRLGDVRYPETLHRCFIINAPMYFRVVWSVVSSILDPSTTLKIRILGGDAKVKFPAISASLRPNAPFSA
mmetsp:Transcript_15647/g.59497  ORF Transcript_15647/g.59497 Transcript_15647/m.59497 type:complete len:332 (+) Transcript_15647:53-1048(+)